MDSRSRLDKYQDLRSGMSMEETDGDQPGFDNGFVDERKPAEELRSSTSYNNYGMNSKSARDLYSTSDYGRLLKEHEEFLKSLDESFGNFQQEFLKTTQRFEEEDRQMTVRQYQPVHRQAPAVHEEEPVQQPVEVKKTEPAEQPSQQLQEKKPQITVKQVASLKQQSYGTNRYQANIGHVNRVEHAISQQPQQVAEPEETKPEVTLHEIRSISSVGQKKNFVVNLNTLNRVEKLDVEKVLADKYRQPDDGQMTIDDFLNNPQQPEAEQEIEKETEQEAVVTEQPEQEVQVEQQPIEEEQHHVIDVTQLNEENSEEQQLAEAVELEAEGQDGLAEDVKGSMADILEKQIQEIQQEAEKATREQLEHNAEVMPVEDFVEAALSDIDLIVDDINEHAADVKEEQPEEPKTVSQIRLPQIKPVIVSQVNPDVQTQDEEKLPDNESLDENQEEIVEEGKPELPQIDRKEIRKPAVSIVYGEHYGEQYNPYNLYDTSEEQEIEETRLPEQPEEAEETSEGITLFPSDGMAEEKPLEGITESHEKGLVVYFNDDFDDPDIKPEVAEGVTENHGSGLVVYTSDSFEDPDDAAPQLCGVTENHGAGLVVYTNDNYDDPDDKTEPLDKGVLENHGGGLVVYINDNYDDPDEKEQENEHVSVTHQDGMIVYTNDDYGTEQQEEADQQEEKDDVEGMIHDMEEYETRKFAQFLVDDDEDELAEPAVEEETKRQEIAEQPADELVEEEIAEPVQQQPTVEIKTPVIPQMFHAEVEPVVIEPVEEVQEPQPEVIEPVEEVQEPQPEVVEPVEEVQEPQPEVSEPVEEVQEPQPEVSEPVEPEQQPDVTDTQAIKNIQFSLDDEEDVSESVDKIIEDTMNLSKQKIQQEEEKLSQKEAEQEDPEENEQVFDYIESIMSNISSVNEPVQNQQTIVETAEPEQQESTVDDITRAISAMDLENFNFTDEKEEPAYTPQLQAEKTEYTPSNNADQPVYYDDPKTISQLTEQLNHERQLREEMLEQTKQLKLQMSEYENEINDTNASMNKTNKLLNFTMTLLILILFVILLIAGFWFISQRGSL